MDVLYNVFRDKKQPMLFFVRPPDGSHTQKTVKAVRFSRFMRKAQKSYAQFHLTHKA